MSVLDQYPEPTKLRATAEIVTILVCTLLVGFGVESITSRFEEAAK